MTRDSPGEIRLLEWIMLGYALLVAGVVSVRAPEMPGWEWLLVAQGLLIGLIGLMTWPRLGRTGRVLREVFPLLLLPALYAELDVLNFPDRGTHDMLIQGWEAALFGGQPSRDWWRAYPSPSWSLLLHGAYLTYYLILAVPPVWLILRRDTLGLRRFLLAVMASFVVCYVFFIFAPVAGPYYEFPRPSGAFVDNITARLVYDALGSGSSYGAAFPSSHVAATVAALAASWRASRRLGLILLVPTLLLTISVVYCQMHYAVDAIAGLAIGLAVTGAVVIGERKGLVVGA